MPLNPNAPPSRPHRTRRSRNALSLRLLVVSALTLVFAIAIAEATKAQTSENVPQVAAPMTVARMAQIFTALDPDVEQTGPAFRMTIEDVPVVVVSDPDADRMRAMVPIRSATGLSEAALLRMLQANFDTALDARYAVAEGRVWAVFIHPLSSLRDDQLILGIGQTVNAALTYGTLYSSGAGQFGRGDSAGQQRQLLERLQRRGQDI
ncbi:hypothetical protein [Jannaschia sp. 2305UL9-9]|uniref:hypothetical protein n=1 Tax=Jannaschia sp. 2305UL9-9 TaxID=3121638 RepID=UPI003528ABCE